MKTLTSNELSLLLVVHRESGLANNAHKVHESMKSAGEYFRTDVQAAIRYAEGEVELVNERTRREETKWPF